MDFGVMLDAMLRLLAPVYVILGLTAGAALAYRIYYGRIMARHQAAELKKKQEIRYKLK